MYDAKAVAKQILTDNWEDLEDLSSGAQATIEYAIAEQLEKARQPLRDKLSELVVDLAAHEAEFRSRGLDTTEATANLYREVRHTITEAMTAT